ncbi:AraC family transcriptional regulator, partial [Cronobacter sakazakii]|uniref:AraC family transcriptional regulator n=1 Tax=Cronobacter sakazakii TaxID=28141 RepID=UPI0028117177
HSEESVTDIAYQCGFGDSNHFSTLFRREFSWSPREIRQGRDGRPDERLNQLIAWLEEHYAEEICWEQLADHHRLSLRTLHR